MNEKDSKSWFVIITPDVLKFRMGWELEPSDFIKTVVAGPFESYDNADFWADMCGVDESILIDE